MDTRHAVRFGGMCGLPEPYSDLTVIKNIYIIFLFRKMSFKTFQTGNFLSFFLSFFLSHFWLGERANLSFRRAVTSTTKFHNGKIKLFGLRGVGEQ